MRRTLFITAILALCTLPRIALAEMPDYDVQSHCAQVASFGGGGTSQMILQGCYRQEQAAYDALKPSWDQLPPQMRQHCDQVAKSGGNGSFMILQGCVRQELDATKQNTDFKFRR